MAIAGRLGRTLAGLCLTLVTLSTTVHAADILVTNPADSGTGTLRWAIAISNSTTGVQSIGFAVSNSITVHTRIEITAQVRLDGAGTTLGSTGTSASTLLYLALGSSGTTLTGFAFVNSNLAVEIASSDNTLSDCRFGVDYAGAARNNTTGLSVVNARNAVTNCIFGNHNNRGIYLNSASYFTATGCYFGLLPGPTPCANNTGIQFFGGQHCRIGGDLTDASQRNVFAWNNQAIKIEFGSYGNTVCGNIIGLNPAMTAAGANGIGININSSAHHNYIGLPLANHGNVISGNGTAGIYTRETSLASYPRNNVIQNNLIGVNPSGALFPNGVGILLQNANGFLIGGSLSSSAREANVISGNTSCGIALSGSGNTISGNCIGADATGYSGLGNNGHGIRLEPVYFGSNTVACRGNLIGGAKSENRGNVIVDNALDGLSLANADANEISGNLIGLAVNSIIQSNGGDGVVLDNAFGNRIGRPDGDYGNVISGNLGSGVHLRGTSSGNTLCGNIIGLARMQGSAVPNGAGVTCNYASGNWIGLPSGAYGANVIAGNTNEGVYLADAAFNRIQTNSIGLNAAGAVFANYSGVVISGGHENLVGGDRAAGAGNVISGNLHDGVFIEDSAANSVCGNVIGLNSGQTLARGNGEAGIRVRGAGAYQNQVGLPSAGWGNIVGGNDLGVYITTAGRNLVQNNRVGLNAADAPFPNYASGLALYLADRNLIGGAGAGNLIASNAGYSIDMNSCAQNTIAANSINLNAAGNSLLANHAEIATLRMETCQGNLIGGAGANGNRICGLYEGVRLDTSSGNTVVGNAFGLLADGRPAAASFATAVNIFNNSHDNLVGDAVGGNLIAGGGRGIWGDGATAYRNGFFRNLISGQSVRPILLTNNSNNGKEAPVITSAFGQTITGQTQMAGDVVEVFQAEAASNTYTSGGSLRYLGRVVAGGSASPAPWSLVAPSVGGEWVCATSSFNQNTSEFSSNVFNTGPTATPTPTPTPTPTITPTETPGSGDITPTSTRPPIEMADGQKVLAFPNPGKQRINFALNLEGVHTVSIDLFKITGERAARVSVVVTGHVPVITWECGSAAKGIYLARITVDGTEWTKLKVAIQ